MASLPSSLIPSDPTTPPPSTCLCRLCDRDPSTLPIGTATLSPYASPRVPSLCVESKDARRLPAGPLSDGRLLFERELFRELPRELV